MNTREVTGAIHTPSGEPWPGARIAFTIADIFISQQGCCPPGVVAAKAEADGTFSITLVPGIRYQIDIDQDASCRTAPVRLSATLPSGDGPLALGDWLAIGSLS